MKVSVVVATYCGEKFLEEQLNTLWTQTRKPDEVIISDDTSKDNTVEVAANFIKNHELQDDWRISINHENKGYARNFLEAALTAKGDIIFFCDQDDLWEDDKIESMIDSMKSNDKIQVLASNLKPFTCEENTRKWDKKDIEIMKNSSGKIDYILIDEDNFHLKRSGCTMCIRRKFLHRIMPYWKSNWAHDDFIWKTAVSSDGLAILQKITLNRRMHENNATVIRVRSQEWRVKQLCELRDQAESLKEYVKDTSTVNKEKKINIIENNINSLNLRIDLVKNKKIWNWLILFFKYRTCYPRIKGIYLDLFLTVKKEYKGV